MSANSVSPPRDEIVRPDSREYLAGTGRNELSECHRRSASLNSQMRSSGDMILPSRVRLEKSAMPPATRSSRVCGYAPGSRSAQASPNWRVKASCCSSVSGWSRKTRTACRSMAASILATSVSGGAQRNRCRQPRRRTRHELARRQWAWEPPQACPPLIGSLSQPTPPSVSFFLHLDYHPKNIVRLFGVGSLCFKRETVAEKVEVFLESSGRRER